MAALNVITDETSTQDFLVIKDFLASQGIDFGRFQRNPAVLSLAEPHTLTDEQRAELIALYPDVREKFERRTGFRCDVVCFYPELPQLNFIIDKFGSIHYHFETEYWYFVDGEAKFGFLGTNGTKFELTVQGGEFLQVPEGCWQWFQLTPIKRMKSIRYFYSTESQKPRVPYKFGGSDAQAGSKPEVVGS
ncbi:MAG TPA: hypothetical protein VFQ61_25275 [Polyangiaceae bacterium]|nr:hypothetical protein [Polyangiaceae bacterium]